MQELRKANMEGVYFTTAYADEYGQKVTAFVTANTYHDKLYHADCVAMEYMVDVPFYETDEKVAQIIYNVPGVKVLDDGILEPVNTTLKRAISKALQKENFVFAEIYI